MAAIQGGDSLGLAQVIQPEEARLLATNAERVVRQLRRFGSLAEGAANTSTSPSLLRQRWRIESVSAIHPPSTRQRAMVTAVPPEITLPGQKLDSISRVLDQPLYGGWLRRFLSKTGTDLDSSIPVSAVRIDRRWYVSLTGTIGSAWDRLAMRKQSVAMPGLVASVPLAIRQTVAADSAEQAVQDWLNALADLDYPTALALTNPVEAEAFPVEAMTAVWGVRITKLRRQFELSVPDATAEKQKRSTRFGMQVLVPVTIRDAKFALTEPGAEPFVAQYHEGCLVILSGGKATKHCGRQIPRFGEQFSIPVSKAIVDRFVGRIDALEAARKSLPGFVVVRQDEKWFVSPAQTLLLSVREGLSNAKRSDIEALVRDLKTAISSDG